MQEHCCNPQPDYCGYMIFEMRQHIKVIYTRIHLTKNNDDDTN